MSKPLESIFIEVVKAGLWEQRCCLKDDFLPEEPIKFSELIGMAKDQAVPGLFVVGLEFVEGLKVNVEEAFPIMGLVQAVKSRNHSMDAFIGKLFSEMREEGINAILLKGQALAQCYLRPLYRACGDIDLLLLDNNYIGAKRFLSLKADIIEKEIAQYLHQAFKIETFLVEAHGNIRTGLSNRIDKVLDAERDLLSKDEELSIWKDGATNIPFPSPNHNVLFVFCHIIQHFFREGIGLKQICDWCRLLWTYRNDIDKKYIEGRLIEMGIMREWRAFAALAVEQLGTPIDAMIFYEKNRKNTRKAKLILRFLFNSRSYENRRDYSYYTKKPYLIRKMISFRYRLADYIHRIRIFPINSTRFFLNSIVKSIVAVSKGK